MDLFIKIKNGFIALFFAILNPSKTFGDFLFNPVKLAINWYCKRQNFNSDASKFRVNSVYEILSHMGDDESREKYLKEVCFRAIFLNSFAYATGLADKINITFSESEYKSRIKSIKNEKLDGIDGSIIKFDDSNKHAHFELGQRFFQYTYKDKLDINKDDIVIDCGAYICDVALVFEKHLGENGQIYCFEPQPEQFKICQSNIKAFGLKRTQVFECGVGNNTCKLGFSEKSEGNARIKENSDFQIQIVKIDDFCNERNVKPTFIKMDIEGFEIEALKGAERIIKDFKPKMAICTYHRTEHLWEIPELILSYCGDYTFYFDKFAPDFEAILYAVCKK